jgi:hypothetical protein
VKNENKGSTIGGAHLQYINEAYAKAWQISLNSTLIMAHK